MHAIGKMFPECFISSTPFIHSYAIVGGIHFDVIQDIAAVVQTALGFCDLIVGMTVPGARKNREGGGWPPSA